MKYPKKRGFTLIELLVVMVIVAVLLSIVAPRYFTHLEHAKEAALKETLVVSRDAIDKFYADTGRYPKDLDELVASRYLRTLPFDPITESTDSWQIISPPEGNGTGVWDIASGASGQTLNGHPFSEF